MEDHLHFGAQGSQTRRTGLGTMTQSLETARKVVAADSYICAFSMNLIGSRQLKTGSHWLPLAQCKLLRDSLLWLTLAMSPWERN
jgi:hypothetical protein